MAEDVQNLRETLGELHRQLEAAQRVDPESMALMRQAMTDLEQALTRAEGGEPIRSAPASPKSAVRRLTDAARGFESTHPMLSGAIGSVIDALAQMGI